MSQPIVNTDPNNINNKQHNDLDHLHSQGSMYSTGDNMKNYYHGPPTEEIDMRGQQYNISSVISSQTAGKKINKKSSQKHEFIIHYKNFKTHMSGKNFADILEKYHKTISNNLKKNRFTFSIVSNKSNELRKYEATKEKIRHPVYKYKTIIKEISRDLQK
jgi:hypothetical protein